MNAINWKKLLLPNIPYLLFVYLFDKVGQAVRLAPGADLSGKVLSLADGFSAAFTNPLPSLARMDLLIGIVGAVLIRLIVYVKGKNAKKYRKGIEYGSARCRAYQQADKGRGLCKDRSTAAAGTGSADHTGRRSSRAHSRRAAASPCAGGRTGTGHRRSRARLGAYRRGAYQKGE